MSRLKPSKPKIVHVQPELENTSEELTMDRPGIDLVEEMTQLFKGYYQTFVGYSGGDVQIPSQASTRYNLVRNTAGAGFWSNSSLKTGVAGFGSILTTLSVGFLLSDEFNNPLASPPLDYTVPPGLISTPDEELSDLDLELLRPGEQPSMVNPVEFSASALPTIPVPELPPIQIVGDRAEFSRPGDRAQQIITPVSRPAAPQIPQSATADAAADNASTASTSSTEATAAATASAVSDTTTEAAPDGASGSVADGGSAIASAATLSGPADTVTGGPAPESQTQAVAISEADVVQEEAQQAVQQPAADSGSIRPVSAAGGSGSEQSGVVESPAQATSAAPIEVGDRLITPVIADGVQMVGLTSEAGDKFVLSCSGRDALLKSIATLVLNENPQRSATTTAEKEVSSDPLLAECTLGRGLLPEALRDQPAHLIYGVATPDQMPEVFREQVSVRPTGRSR